MQADTLKIRKNMLICQKYAHLSPVLFARHDKEGERETRALLHIVDEVAHALLAHVHLQYRQFRIKYSLFCCAHLIPGVVEQLSLLLHERRRLGEEAHADCLDVLQVHHVDVLDRWQR